MYIFSLYADGWDGYGKILPWDFLRRKMCGKHFAHGESCEVKPVEWTFAGAKTDQGLFYYIVATNNVTSVEIEVDPVCLFLRAEIDIRKFTVPF